MPQSVAGLLIFLVAVLLGASYVWGYERQAGDFGITLADRTLRFISASVVTHIVLGWPEYALYRWLLTEHVSTGVLRAGEFAAVWFGITSLIGMPALFGTVVGGLYVTQGSTESWTWVRRHLSSAAERKLLEIVVGRSPAPRAWDYIFSSAQSAT